MAAGKKSTLLRLLLGIAARQRQVRKP